MFACLLVLFLLFVVVGLLVCVFVCGVVLLFCGVDGLLVCWCVVLWFVCLFSCLLVRLFA